VLIFGGRQVRLISDVFVSCGCINVVCSWRSVDPAIERFARRAPTADHHRSRRRERNPLLYRVVGASAVWVAAVLTKRPQHQHDRPQPAALRRSRRVYRAARERRACAQRCPSAMAAPGRARRSAVPSTRLQEPVFRHDSRHLQRLRAVRAGGQSRSPAPRQRRPRAVLTVATISE
jgi:hypothetical protein